MEQENQKSRPLWFKYFAAIIMLLLLAGLPLGSWYYLQSGLNYQKQLRAELKDLGQVPNFELTDQEGNIFSSENLKGKLSVVAFVDPKEQTGAAGDYMQQLLKLQDQFEKRSDLVFLTHVRSGSDEGSAKLASFLDKHQLLDAAQCYFFPASDRQLNDWATQRFHLPKSESSSTVNPYLGLIDANKTLLKYYDSRSESEIKKLVEHIAILLPKSIPDRPELLRETEK